MPKHVTISIKPDQRLSRYGVWCFQEYNAPQVSHDMLQSSPPSTKHQTMFDKAQALVHALPCLDSANHPLSLLLLFILLCVFVLLCLVSFFVLVTFPLEPPFRPSTMLPPQQTLGCNNNSCRNINSIFVGTTPHTKTPRTTPTTPPQRFV